MQTIHLIFFGINLIPKWRSINYSFVCMLISSLCLGGMYKRQAFWREIEAKRANRHANKRIIFLPPFWNKVYNFVLFCWERSERTMHIWVPYLSWGSDNSVLCIFLVLWPFSQQFMDNLALERVGTIPNSVGDLTFWTVPLLLKQPRLRWQNYYWPQEIRNRFFYTDCPCPRKQALFGHVS